MTKITRALTHQEQLNYLITNRIPRRLLTRFMGWYSQIENPFLTKASIFIWKLFANDIDLSEAKATEFKSLHECFIRELKENARCIDHRENIVVSPCDAIVGACGVIDGTTLYQAKGYPYELGDLIPDKRLQKKYLDGIYVTLRLKSSMYHRFHAPISGQVHQINYISGDTWNVNPVALKRIEKLFCKNERAVVEIHAENTNDDITLVPVAAILVASMKFNCINGQLDLAYQGPNLIPCNAQYQKGDEMGYFQHGSTIILFATSRYALLESIRPGGRINMGEPLLVKQDE